MTDDTVSLEFQRSDGTLVTQVIDFRNVSKLQKGHKKPFFSRLYPIAVLFPARFIKKKKIRSIWDIDPGLYVETVL